MKGKEKGKLNSKLKFAISTIVNRIAYKPTFIYIFQL